MQKKIEEKSFLFEIIVSELFALNSLYLADKPCHRLSMCQQIVLGFCVSLKETSSNATTCTVINK